MCKRRISIVTTAVVAGLVSIPSLEPAYGGRPLRNFVSEHPPASHDAVGRGWALGAPEYKTELLAQLRILYRDHYGGDLLVAEDVPVKPPPSPPGGFGYGWALLTNCQYIISDSDAADRFRVTNGTNEFTVRLYQLAAPNPDLRDPAGTRQQSEYFGVSAEETIKAGIQARNAMREFVRKPFSVHTRWEKESVTGTRSVYYAFVGDHIWWSSIPTGPSLGRLLMSEGLARAIHDPSAPLSPSPPRVEQGRSEFQARLTALLLDQNYTNQEASARIHGRGIWATSTKRGIPP